MADYDLAVVGAGILGLAHALAAVRLGKRVVVIERDQRANGASIRNFGFITVTGQQRGQCWQRARRSRDVWAEIAPRAGIDVVQEGLAVVARRPEAAAVLAAFLRTEMGEDCTLHDPTDAARRFPQCDGAVEAVLWSPIDLRVESRDAIPRLTAWLASQGVTFVNGASVLEVAPPVLRTSRGTIRAGRVVVCPGDDLAALFPERMAALGIGRCKLQMMRLQPQAGFELPGAVMTDLSLVRYLGYAELPEATALRVLLEREQAPHLAGGVHLIAVQSGDGSLVVGDTHRYGVTMDPFSEAALDALVLGEFEAVFPTLDYSIEERWIGTYASLPDRLMVVDRPSDLVRLVVVTSGTGASTSFAIGEEVVQEIFA
jgi:D-hydroxyproline dehydrogenase subunit beta